uniref:EMAP like 2 n=1 Tax=Eptatretus burgeri TaxID=7764 RepID=A0A8C4QLL8_EPTBU
DEVALLKAALADVIRRVGGEDDGRKALGRTGTPLCGLPTLPTLPSRPALSNGCMVQRKSPTTGSLPSSGKKESILVIISLSSPPYISFFFCFLLFFLIIVFFLAFVVSEEGYVKMYLRGRPITMYVPQEKVDAYRLDIRLDPPSERLKLDWVYPSAAKFHCCCSNEPVFAAEFHPTEPNLVITCGKSHVHFWTMDNGVLSKKQGIFEKHEKAKYILCVTFTESGDAITGDSSGNIYIWGKGTNRISLALCAAHDGGIFALCTRRDGSLLSGGKDRKLIAWDTSFRKTHEAEIQEAFGPVRTIAEGRAEMLLVGTTRNAILQGSMTRAFQPVVQGHTDEMWGLAAHPSQAAFLTCACDRQAIFWDAHTHHPLWVHHLEDPALSADFSPSGTVVAIGSHFGRWLVLDVETQEVITAHTDGPEHLSVMRYSPDGTFLAVGSHDNNIYVYAVDENGGKYTRLGKCVGHSSFITHLDWSADGKHLISNSGDYEILYWLATSCKQVTSAASVRSVEWATYTCVLGFHVYGVWSDGSDGTDINALCRSHSQHVLAIADDFGKVQLFPFPCAPCHIYGGHSSHVTNVGFSHDDSLLFSTGGKDCSILQWRVV